MRLPIVVPGYVRFMICMKLRKGIVRHKYDVRIARNTSQRSLLRKSSSWDEDYNKLAPVTCSAQAFFERCLYLRSPYRSPRNSAKTKTAMKSTWKVHKRTGDYSLLRFINKALGPSSPRLQALYGETTRHNSSHACLPARRWFKSNPNLGSVGRRSASAGTGRDIDAEWMSYTDIKL